MAEKIATLVDSIDGLLNLINKLNAKQIEIEKTILKVEQPYRNILNKVYIQGKTLVTTASEMGYDYKYMCKMHGIALEKFDNTTKEV